jgi:hypothetical protein
VVAELCSCGPFKNVHILEHVCVHNARALWVVVFTCQVHALRSRGQALAVVQRPHAMGSASAGWCKAICVLCSLPGGVATTWGQ